MRTRVDPSVLAWVLAALLANVPALVGGATEVAQVAVAVVGIAHCVTFFWRDGGARISVPGVYFFAAGLFVFFPGLYVTLNGADLLHGPMALLPALDFWLAAQLVMHHLVWEGRAAAPEVAERPTSPAVLRWGRACGLVLAAVGTVVSYLRLGDPTVVSGVAFTGVVLLATATFARPGRVSPLGYLLVAGAAAAYVAFVFTGFGRLQLGALGLALAVVVAPRWPGRTVKAALLLGTVPVLLALARARVAFAEQVMGAAVAAQDTGLESVYAPFVRFSELWYMHTTRGLDLTYLHTFWAAAVAMVPRELWPGKPVGFGAELAEIFRPDLAGSGHSELALLSGEMVFAGGFLGLALLPLLLAWVVQRLDRLLAGPTAAAADTRARLLRTVTVVILSASVADLVWGGTFAYASRVGPRLLVVLLLFVVFAWAAGRTRSEGGSSARRPGRRPGAARSASSTGARSRRPVVSASH